MSSDRREFFDTAGVKDPGMCGNSIARSRESPATPDGGVGADGRRRLKAVMSDMHVSRESDGLIVPTKRANKGRDAWPAESAEGRR